MKQIPLQAIPSQTVSIILNDQNCIINVYYKTTGLYFDLLVDGTPIVTARICRDRCRLIRHEYLGFSGELFFVDRQGLLDPLYTGLADRFELLYSLPGEI